MIVYPLEKYNTFIDVATATTRLTELGTGTQWDNLTSAEQEQMLIISGAIIVATSYIADNTCNYVDAQVMLIHSDIINNNKYLSGVETTQAYTKAKVGSLQVEYNIKDTSVIELPSIVKSILGSCLKNSDKPIATGFTLA